MPAMDKKNRLYLALIHSPVYNKHREKIASALTTLDLHDLARVCRTYEIKRLYVVTPLVDQQELARWVVDHWTTGYGASYNPDRKEAMELVAVSADLEEVVEEVRKAEGEEPVLLATDAARPSTGVLNFPAARGIIVSGRPVMLLLGTAWGLHRDLLKKADYVLEPVSGSGDYNHLSVRTAAAIIVDRLMGRPEHAKGGAPGFCKAPAE